MAEIIVRRARTEDLEAIVRLWREMWDFHTPLDPRFQATPAADGVMERWIGDDLDSERAAVFVAEELSSSAGRSSAPEAEPGRPLGYCHVMILENPPVVPWQFYGYVSEIAVRRKRGGVGGKLLAAAHEWFRGHGLPYVEVNVSVRNAVARGFWRKYGYGDFLERLRLEL